VTTYVWNSVLDHSQKGIFFTIFHKKESFFFFSGVGWIQSHYKQNLFYSKFITENSVRVQQDSKGITGSTNLEAVAILTPKNQRVLVLNNRDTTANYGVTVNDVSIDGKHLTLNPEARSFTTIVWNATS
jgi:O-glycosyl hydrolase